MLKELVKERLMAAADEIFALFERTMAAYEEELCRTREEKERRRQPLAAALCKTNIRLQVGHAHQLTVGSTALKQEDYQPPHVKEEECLLEEVDLTKLPMTVVSVKTEDHKDDPPESSRVQHSPNEENRGAELPSSSSPQHMTTETDGDCRGGSQVDSLFAPLSDSDDTTSHSPGDDVRDDPQELPSSETDSEADVRICNDNKHSDCAEKTTRKERFTCSFCAKSFFYKSYLARHMRTHTKEKPFRCSVCGKRFSRKQHVVGHMRTHTGEKPFGCSVCGDRFAVKANLKRHMTTHMGDKPFSCSVCGKKFFRKDYAILHMRRHTGEKCFTCTVCAKRFSYYSHLKSHMRTHTGEKPFSCSVCGDTFGQKSTLNRHMGTHASSTLDVNASW